MGPPASLAPSSSLEASAKELLLTMSTRRWQTFGSACTELKLTGTVSGLKTKYRTTLNGGQTRTSVAVLRDVDAK